MRRIKEQGGPMAWSGSPYQRLVCAIGNPNLYFRIGNGNLVCLVKRHLHQCEAEGNFGFGCERGI